jgi:hypothetical protein
MFYFENTHFIKRKIITMMCKDNVCSCGSLFYDSRTSKQE